MRLTFWPRSLFGRLLAASVLALLVAQVVSLMLVARERERFMLQTSVREWSRRIAEVTTMLQTLKEPERDLTAARLSERPWHPGRHPPPDVLLPREALPSVGDPRRLPPDGPPGPDEGLPPPDALTPDPGSRGAAPAPGLRAAMHGPAHDDNGDLLTRLTGGRSFVLPVLAGDFDFEEALREQLQSALGNGFEITVAPAADPARRAIAIGGPLFTEGREASLQWYDTTVTFPDGYQTLFRVARQARGVPLPRGLFMNVTLLVIVMVIALFVTARSITRPLSDLARAADRVGRELRQPKLAERGARELRDAARAFNTMQDRLQRYLDSRSRVLAAMSHDLKTPLTRLRLQVEMLEDQAAQERIGRQLDEMEGMVHGALALFRGLDDNEALIPVDINDLLATLRAEFAEMNAVVCIEGRALRPIPGKPQALRRCLTNLIANAIKFGSRADILVEDGPALTLRIRDEGPGIPVDELEKVFEPFYRVESSRSRDTGGTGLGLSIARDVMQAHGGTIQLCNRPVRGLEAILTLPRI